MPHLFCLFCFFNVLATMIGEIKFYKYAIQSTSQFTISNPTVFLQILKWSKKHTFSWTWVEVPFIGFAQYINERNLQNSDTLERNFYSRSSKYRRPHKVNIAVFVRYVVFFVDGGQRFSQWFHMEDNGRSLTLNKISILTTSPCRKSDRQTAEPQHTRWGLSGTANRKKFAR
jgi:hypothetical protein